MIRALPFLLASALLYLVALTFGVQATLLFALGHYWPAAAAYAEWLISTVLLYVFGALSWLEIRKNRVGSVKKTGYYGW